ncbi:DUF4232 domain-containing protein [Streptomyces glaucescens]|uniref:DUF4232 domain-containing protein n=1 Tax=Streptomyces glaucescens TaxID=1907 RepID=A0A089X7A7_STRGA|nr:DUF4232 domain-containing protein [Streptomyces glaucescens]AIR99797.1 hypothetical protein SGLAU_19200 [Streptomyces glaucescens]
MRTFRHTRLLAVTGAALTALALTACEDGTGTRDEGASAPAATPTASATAPPSAAQSPSGTAEPAAAEPEKTPAEKPASPAPTKAPGAAAGADDGPVRTVCNGSNTKVTAQPVPRPLNHMLLTVTNTGAKPCNLMYYPVLRFDEMQWVPQARPDTKPQAVPTLAPGESGYAGVLLSAADGSGDGGTTARKLTVAFQGGTPNSDGGPAATPPLPAAGVYYDSSLTVTYWRSSMEDALG